MAHAGGRRSIDEIIRPRTFTVTARWCVITLQVERWFVLTSGNIRLSGDYKHRLSAHDLETFRIPPVMTIRQPDVSAALLPPCSSCAEVSHGLTWRKRAISPTESLYFTKSKR